MRLKQINLAGFKSFVDPTRIPFEQQMTAIVGPNGCGKSNVIDAVRWVLGESSAKNLRGDSMTDVIFNGAATRKPIGQASVELIFTNAQGRLKGSMADRNEVSIRRIVNRDSVNTYYLNGAKCRRRDITDIFLGTGLGPRSYAIIEQGTISRLIESKPQELRVFIEEAAGISKYKERRRETETRISHTRENLARLFDIRSELTLQVDKLHQQAEAAKHFKTLKTSERKYKAELAVLRWQQFNEKSESFLQLVKKSQGQVAHLYLEQKQLDVFIFNIKHKIRLDGESLDELQKTKLELTQNIAKIEQKIKYAQQHNISLKNELAKTKQQYSDIKILSAQAIAEQKQIDSLLAQELPKLQMIEQQIDSTQKLLTQLTGEQQLWQVRWDEFTQLKTEKMKQQSQFDSKISAQQTFIKTKNSREHEIVAALSELDSDSENKKLVLLNSSLRSEKSSLAHITTQKNELNHQVSINEEKLVELHQNMAKEQGLQQALKLNLQQLDALNAEQPQWALLQAQFLEGHSIKQEGELYQHIIVDDKWQLACEQILMYWLQAQVVNELPQEVSLDTIFMIKSNSNRPDVKPGTLAEKVEGQYPFTSWLNLIYLADDLSQAHNLLVNLAADESVICPDSTWLGHGFLRKGFAEQSSGVLQRIQNIKGIKKQLNEIDHWLIAHQEQIKTVTDEIAIQHNQQNTNVLFYQEKQVHCQQLEKNIALTEQKYQQLNLQQTVLQEQLTLVKQELLVGQETLTHYLEQQSLILQSQITDDITEQLISERNQFQQKTHETQNAIQLLHHDRHKAGLAVEQAKHKKIQSDLLIYKTEEKIIELESQIVELNKQVVLSGEPLDVDNSSLQQWLLHMSTVDAKLVDIHQGQSSFHQEIIKFEQDKNKYNIEIEQIKAQISQNNLEGESFRLRAEAVLEQLVEMQQNFTQVSANMSNDAKEGVWQAHVIRLAKDINRLGAINLAAIGEYESQLERKIFLDQQNDDLTEAIFTLESVIAKIDKESRQKFKATFDQVNIDLKILFPKVFGGGSAYLELTGEDLLETGVSIMARPPGKKNSTIHLLSGGEKALTALSLVFAIFRLNPAPFCMLDEVDAPLDDANVERFCNLVREMSQTVQFIYISHNKIAMEMASHLTGVTMFEPGVSKMVAVDIEEALSMAEN